MYVIKDPVHGGMKLSALEMRLVDTWAMQRLRGIKQLGITYLVYPGATNTRFEHSLGTMHLAGLVCDNVGIEGGERAKIRLAAMLHDVGHGPFSHESEPFMVKYARMDHEKAAEKRICGGEIAELLDKSGFEPKEIVALAQGKGKGKLITCGIGADRMDYLLRDARYTGVAYGVIDSDRILNTIRLKGNDIVIDESGVEPAESLLIARHMMFSNVYLHHAVRIASAMLGRAITAAIEGGTLDAAELPEMDDAGLMLELMRNEDSAGLASRLRERRLYKRACVVEVKNGKGKTNSIELASRIAKKGGDGETNAVEFASRIAKKKIGIDAVELASRIAKKAGVDEYDVVVDPPSLFAPENAGIMTADGEKDLGEFSDIVKALRKSEESRRKLIVACPGEKIEKVRKACEKML